MRILKGVMLCAALAVPGAGAVPDKGSAVGEIVCVSDSAAGMELAESAARFLVDRRQDRHYAKSFVVTDREDQASDRYLILILSPDGDTAFGSSRQGFEDTLLALLQKMRNHFGDDKARVILQHPDKSNAMEAFLDAAGAGSLKTLDTPPASPSPAPAAAAAPAAKL
jgi:hypothetical protein